MSVVGLAGRIGSGKSTVAAHLVQQHGFTEYTAAQPLKEACCAVFGLTMAQVYDADLKATVHPRWGVTPRRILQAVGTDLFRDQIRRVMPDLQLPAGRGIWAEVLRNRLLDARARGERVVVSDVRFDDEIDMIRELGGVVLYIDRRQSHDNAASTHASEQLDLDKTDDVIVNDGTLQELFAKVTQALAARNVS